MTVRRKQAVRWSLAAGIFLGAPLWLYSCMIPMPGKSHQGPLPPLSPAATALADSLRRDVVELSEKIGERNTDRYDALRRTADYLESELKTAGAVSRQTYSASGRACDNLEVEIRGTTAPGEIVVVGAHYDSVRGCPGANDNASGVAGMLALARSLEGSSPGRTLRFVAFVNEEPPHFQSSEMGSRVYASRCRHRSENVVAMLSLETIGYYSDEEGSQNYPPPFGIFYPSRGDFIAFVGNLSSRKLVRRCVRTFREQAPFPSEGGALPSFMPGVGWSDHESFWQKGYPALMVTDTAPFRYPHYHTADDTTDKIDFERAARVIEGIHRVLRDLAEIRS
jgi:Zn-dependent M28 family amino/carboxypeptidase